MAQDSAIDANNSQQDPRMRALNCIVLGSGVIGCLLIYDRLQEKIMKHSYDGEMFVASVFLVTCNRLCAVLFAGVMAMYHRESIWHQAPLWKYAVVSVANVYASTCQYEALKYVTFAVQMLGKSFKMMPVMMWGIVISKKSYRLVDWLVAICVTLGCTEFLLTGPTSAHGHSNNSWIGYILLLAFLTLDGLTSTMQEKLFKEQSTTKYNQMLYINLISSLIGIITQLVQGSFWYSLNFFASHGAFVADNILLSVSAVGGQFFIYSQVKEFGALVFAATMNVRQIASIVLSYLTYHHHITPWQIVGLCITFSALFYKVYQAFMQAKMNEAEEITKSDKTSLLPYVRNTPDVESNASKNEAVSCYESTGNARQL